MRNAKQAAVRSIAFIGSYTPRQCGIATFTQDLSKAICDYNPDMNCFIVPVNDTVEGYDYPDEVRFEIQEQNIDSYRTAADYLNINGVDLVCLQHEYGIYGGTAGSHILALLRELRMPVVTTFHTVLKTPDTYQRKVLTEIARLSDRVVVMSQIAVDFLTSIYEVPADKIDLIHHGIPDIPFVDPNFYKDQFGVEGKPLLLTFGLLSANKGIENVINALPAVIEHYPDVMYFVVGATHPNVLRHDGEDYRLRLRHIARQKGVSDHVVFFNRFVSMKELIEFIGATDIYITPYLNQAQIVSGTLAYTVGAGKAVISTPYWYAEELLDEGRGSLVPFGDSEAIADQVIYMLDHESERHAIRKKAYLFGREMIWPVSAQHYRDTFERASQTRELLPRPASDKLYNRPIELPPLKLDHIDRMTDNTGIFQHALYDIPNFQEGYTTDDNARALILCVLLEKSESSLQKRAQQLSAHYMAFLNYAYSEVTGRFRNFMSFDRRWLEDIGSEDSHGRALWALGTVLGRSNSQGMAALASRILVPAVPIVETFTSPRAWAYTILGLHEYRKRFAGDRVAHDVMEHLGENLFGLYGKVNTAEWSWFEDVVSYGNAILPHALLICGQELDRADMTEAALQSLRWLVEVQYTGEDFFQFIGNQGFYKRDGEKATFDQQPIEAQAMVSACLYAYTVTQDMYWYQQARAAFEWLLGRNHLGELLYVPYTGGCRDGLHPNAVNQNQGAESTLSYLISSVEIQLIEAMKEFVNPLESQTPIQSQHEPIAHGFLATGGL
ncbi:MAG: glycosyltransferase family 4 protein [Chloroflexi bacterium]|nr:glycosyltransferase family 4 protein [Chloroflexota bacterium]MCC6895193.1 glycosyltransferase family 4 protein [Anaerolineae bacterium]